MLNEVNESIKRSDTIKDSEVNEQAGKTSKRRTARSKKSLFLSPISDSSESGVINTITSRSKGSSNNTKRLTLRKKSTSSNSAVASIAPVAQ